MHAWNPAEGLFNADPLNLYTSRWYAKMTQIWRDRVDLMGVVRTGTLRSSISGGGLSINSTDIQAMFRFVTYGIYVDAGVGNGYRHGNEGNLEFLGKEYRKAHHMGKPRQRNPWFSPSWYISREVLKNKLADLMGEEFVGALAKTITGK